MVVSNPSSIEDEVKYDVEAEEGAEQERVVEEKENKREQQEQSSTLDETSDCHGAVDELSSSEFIFSDMGNPTFQDEENHHQHEEKSDLHKIMDNTTVTSVNGVGSVADETSVPAEKVNTNTVLEIPETPKVQPEVTETTAPGKGTNSSVSYPAESTKLLEPAKPTKIQSPVTAASAAAAAAKQKIDKCPLVSLPLDSLHSIASFLTPSEWSEFGKTCTTALKVCREIVRHVRLHGFRCATEVVTAWKLKQHEDAKELAALYISSGVPIYPKSLGHSYHTILWKMMVAAREVQAKSQTINNDNNTVDTAVSSMIDAFHLERLEYRNRERYSTTITYLTEKALFWTDKTLPKDTVAAGRGRATSPASSVIATTTSITGANRTINSSPRRDDHSPAPSARNKIPLLVHQHLLDQHLFGRNAVNDRDGSMYTPPVSLSAEFFHPIEVKTNEESHGAFDILIPDRLEVPVSLPIFRDPHQQTTAPRVRTNPLPPPPALEDFDEANDPFGEPHDPFLAMRASPPIQKLNAALASLDLEVYSSALQLGRMSDAAESQEMKRHLRSRFATYQRRLEALLAHFDHSGFDDCLFDFWDEFFPHTAGIHYHDRHTAVPRISNLRKFLTKPCPKSIGVVQCEIERIKINARGKGSVKSRLFPTYEYRLFIRNRPNHDENGGNDFDNDFNTNNNNGNDEQLSQALRRDTVLMVAKNRGRKHAEASGVIPSSASSKKGSNNYYLYMPQQTDVDAHFNKVNDTAPPLKMNPNGASHNPVLMSDDAGTVLLGRLHSNFIGTEFEIFTPRLRKRPKRKVPDVPSIHYSPSDDELDYDSGFSSDNNSTRAPRTSRFHRLSLRRSSNPNHDVQDVHHSQQTNQLSSPLRRGRSPLNGRTHKRSSSCPDMPQRATRTNRRAIANTPECHQQEPTMCEEEDGVITYTANLLGSRPRIMDVCIPKVTSDGVVGIEWRRYLESVEDPEDCRMLNCFRQLQQRQENQPEINNHLGIHINPPGFNELNNNNAHAAIHNHQQQNNNNMVNNNNNNDNNTNQQQHAAETDGGSEHQDATPGDFGLLALQNRPPWWNIELGSFVLNFGGRVSLASVKNFQLCDRNDQDRILLQFGRIEGRHSFTMDFQHPLTAVQAFSIAISSLQSKISFG